MKFQIFQVIGKQFLFQDWCDNFLSCIWQHWQVIVIECSGETMNFWLSSWDISVEATVIETETERRVAVLGDSYSVMKSQTQAQ